MSPKGLQVYLHHRRILLLHGARKTTKSNTIQNMVINHCWMNSGAVFAIVVHGLTTSVGGCWEDIIGPRGILETEWFKADTGCEYSKRPSFVRDTKMRYFRIWTRDGGESEVQLHTLERDSKVEKFKDGRFSGVYLVEADKWGSVGVLNGLIAQLRVPAVPHHRREVFLDCNPPKKGRKSWLYEKFILDREGRYPPTVNNNIQEVRFTLDDNPFLPPEEKEEIRTSNEHDPVELARNYYGEWVASRDKTAFETQFKPSVHVVGDLSPHKPEARMALLPPRGCMRFPCGWDPGEAMNHAAVIACKVVDVEGNRQIYIIDELVRTDVNYSVGKFAQDFMFKVERWTKIMKERGTQSIQWKHWSDSSSLRYSAIADSTVAKEIRAASNGMIRLDGVKKGAGSVYKRLDLLRRLLHNNRLFISATCQHVVMMLEEIQTDDKDDIDPKDPHKHIFDALTYMLMYEIGIIDTPVQPRSSPVIRIA